VNESWDPRQPALIERAPVFVDGQSGTRLMFVFRAMGCAYALRPDGGCSNCGFQPLSTRGTPVSAADLKAQFDGFFEDPGALEGVVEIDLYNSGSFLADREIPPDVRTYVLERLGRTSVRRILIESRPEFVTSEKISVLSALVDGRRLEVGIGLESADDHVREVLVRKGFGRGDFERAVRTLAGLPVRLLVYLLVKPLGLTEAAAIEDAVASARYVFDVGREAGVAARVALQPVFVAQGTALETDFLAGRYHPPSLWSVVEVVRRVHGQGEVLVGMSDEGLRPHLVPRGCDRCTASLRAALIAYNQTAELAAFDGLDCECRRHTDRS
jgi:archaeosine synthase beta-subunit